MQGKLRQFDAALGEGIVSPNAPVVTCSGSLTPHAKETQSLALQADEMKLIEEIFSYLSCVVSTPPTRPSVSLTGEHLEVIIHVLERWPAKECFPGLSLQRPRA
jgi:hypothetical protein